MRSNRLFGFTAVKVSHVVTAAVAVLLLGSMSAFAAKAPPPVQVPLSPTKIPQFVQEIDLLRNGGVPVSLYPSATNISLCEFQTDVLPPGTPLVAPPPGAYPTLVLGKTFVWGYQEGTVCNPLPGPAVPPLLGALAGPPTGRAQSYLGPVVLAERHNPTAMTFINQLPDANAANVKAYTTSSDQTLIWGDPLGLLAAPVTGFSGIVEGNECWFAAQELVPPALLPASCNNNYGFLAPWVGAAKPASYAAPVPAAVHIHGGEVPSVLDGGPDSWWTPSGIFGHGYYTRHVNSLPQIVAAQPVLPPTVADITAGPSGYPSGTTVFNLADANYYVNAIDPLTLAETWTVTAAPYPADTLIQVTGGSAFVFDITANAWVGGIAPFTDGQLVYNVADDQNYLLSGGVWGVAAIDRATYVYPNGQEAAPVWFHDHMLGATRLNVYAGIAGGYVITESPATLTPGLHPLGLGDTTATSGAQPLTELVEPLIIQDRMFDTNGQLFFPNVGINPEHPYWVPEFVGDVIVVNGKAWPFMNVQPKRYKFIFLNGSNARAYELFLMSKTTGLKGPMMWVVANDQGYLDQAQGLDPNLNVKLAMMPGERYEVVIDFTGLDNQIIEMRNTARTPYVGGAPVNGNTTGKILQFRVGAVPVADNSFNPATNPAVRTDTLVRLTDPLTGTPALIPGTATPVTIDRVRRLTLNEVIGPGGPLEVLVNNTLYDGSDPKLAALGIGPRADFKPITSIWNTTYYSELPYEGETELWEIINITADAHPMHPHLVGFQVLNRTPLDVKAYTAFYNNAYLAAGLPIDGAGPPYNYNDSNNPANCSQMNPARGDLRYQVTAFDPLTGSAVAPCYLGGNPDPAAALALIGPPVPPMPQEVGWKDTVQALPNMVTRVLVRFGRPDIPVGTPSAQVGYDFSPNGGHGYVWHCHIVDHEDNEMMRPFTVENGPYQETYLKGIHY